MAGSCRAALGIAHIQVRVGHALPSPVQPVLLLDWHVTRAALEFAERVLHFGLSKD